MAEQSSVPLYESHPQDLVQNCENMPLAQRRDDLDIVVAGPVRDTHCLREVEYIGFRLSGYVHTYPDNLVDE